MNIKVLIAAILTFFSVSIVSAADKSVKEYLADLSSSDEKLVIAAERALGKKEEKSAVEKLTQLLVSDQRKQVRLHAAIALGLIKEKKSVDSLISQLLEEQDPDVRYTIVLAVSRIGIETKESLAALIEAKDKETDPFILDYIKKLEEKLKK